MSEQSEIDDIFGWQEPSSEEDRLARLVIGDAIEVHRILGPGYVESVYQEALEEELRLRGIPFTSQVPFALDYKGKPVGAGKLDLLVGGVLVVELKAVEAIAPIHRAQAISYLKATKHRLSLLMNFNSPTLKDGLRRIIRTGPNWISL